jgi:hypothetical protein
LTAHLLQGLEDRRQVEDASADEVLYLVLGVHEVPDVVLVGQTTEYHLQPILLHHLHHLERKVVRVVKQLYRTGLE